jgi:hypothetical protein
MPTVIRKANGRLIIRSNGRRGFTTVQVTREGEQQLREKFPASHHSLHELSIDKDTFWGLAQAGCLYTEASGSKWFKQNWRRRRFEQYATSDNQYSQDDFPQSHAMPVARDRQPIAPKPPNGVHQPAVPPVPSSDIHSPATSNNVARPKTDVPAAQCPSCRFILPAGAHFCPRCGRASQGNNAGRFFWGFLAAAAVIAFLYWKAVA